MQEGKKRRVIWYIACCQIPLCFVPSCSIDFWPGQCVCCKYTLWPFISVWKSWRLMTPSQTCLSAPPAFVCLFVPQVGLSCVLPAANALRRGLNKVTLYNLIPLFTLRWVCPSHTWGLASAPACAGRCLSALWPLSFPAARPHFGKKNEGLKWSLSVHRAWLSKMCQYVEDVSIIYIVQFQILLRRTCNELLDCQDIRLSTNILGSGSTKKACWAVRAMFTACPSNQLSLKEPRSLSQPNTGNV